MGTEINLKVGGISLADSKNFKGIDFGHLFQESDRTRRKMEEINYEYYEENPDEIGELEVFEMVFARCQRRSKNEPLAGVKVHHFADRQVCP